MSDSVERLLVRIDATSEQLRRELKVADQAVGRADQSMGQRLKKMQSRFSDVAKNAAKMGAAVGVAGAAITTKLVSAGLQSVDSLAKVSSRLGIATENLAELRFAAEQTGVSTKTLDMALQRMTRRVAEAAQGTGEAKGALKELGLSATELNDLAPDKVFRRVTDAMGDVANQSDKVRLAMKLFDSEGVSLVQTMRGGTEALDEFAEQARLAGLTISEFDAAKVEAANDAMNRVSKQFQGLGQQLAIRFAPILEAIADRFFGIGKEAGGVGNIATKAFSAITKAAGIVGNSIRVLQLGWNGMKLAFQEAARFIASGLDSMARHAIEMYNKLPWVDKVEVESMFGGFLATMDSEIAASKKKIDDLLSAPLPSDAIETFTETASRQFNATAIAAGTITSEMLLAEKESEKAAAKLESDWDKALQGTFERIDQSFAQAWQGAFDSFSDFASGIKNALKNLLGELAHQAISKPILMNIGASLGIGGMSSSAMASGGGLLSGGIGGIMSSIGGFGAGAMNALGSGASFLADMGVPGMDALSQGAFGQGMTMTGGTALMGAGAGLLGGFAGNAVFGETSGIGSSLGGMAGMALGGPIGAGIGSFLGSGIESLFSSKPKNRISGATIGPNGTSFLSQGNSETTQQVNELAGVLGQFRMALGGSDTQLGVSVGSQGGLYLGRQSWDSTSAGPGYNGYTFQYGDDAEGFLRHAFEQLVEGAEQLSPSLKDLIQAFQGSNEEMALFAQSMVGISEAVSGNVVRDLRDAWVDMSENSATSAYQSQIDAIRTMTQNFDGSAIAAQNLNSALAQNQQVAVQLAIQIKQVSDQIGGMFTNSAKQIRESVMSEAELMRIRKEERDALRSSLGTITDPQELAQAAAEINRLNLELFNSLDGAEAQAMRAEGFAKYAEQTDKIAQERLEVILDGIEEAQNQQNQRVTDMMESAATQQQAAANTFLEAAEIFAGAAGSFRFQEVNA